MRNFVEDFRCLNGVTSDFTRRRIPWSLVGTPYSKYWEACVGPPCRFLVLLVPSNLLGIVRLILYPDRFLSPLHETDSSRFGKSSGEEVQRSGQDRVRIVDTGL